MVGEPQQVRDCYGHTLWEGESIPAQHSRRWCDGYCYFGWASGRLGEQGYNGSGKQMVRSDLSDLVHNNIPRRLPAIFTRRSQFGLRAII
jgi:hypothetical protein